MNILTELGQFVQERRKHAFDQQDRLIPQKLTRIVKKVKEINMTLFYRKFGTFHALAQLFELSPELKK